ncbi:MAG: hypothetical protein GZ087_10825 [Flavobacterium sp.]|nr:hypothetical protein [Flavobacterium sp.]
MKKQYNKYYLAVFYLCFNLVLFAQPSSTNNTSDLESVDVAPAPINNYLVVLAFVGILLIFMKLRSFQYKKIPV